MMIYVNKDGRVDDTYEALKELITIPIHYIKVDEIESYLKDLDFNYWEKWLDPEMKVHEEKPEYTANQRCMVNIKCLSNQQRYRTH